MYSATLFSDGDFANSLPGTFPQPITLSSWQMETFLRGPSQFLTIAPLAFAGSYEAIARILLPIYAVAIPLLAVLSIVAFAARSSTATLPIWTATLAFAPLHEALIGREFEMVIAVATAIAFITLRRSPGVSFGVTTAYIAFYKYVPLLALPYILLKRWTRPALGFVVAGAIIVALASAAFGWRGFVNNHIPAKAADLITGFQSNETFCKPPAIYREYREESDDLSLKARSCVLATYLGVPAPSIFALVLFATIAGIGWAVTRLRRTTLTASDAASQRLIEFAMLTVVGATYFYSHYYYLCVLILPINLLLARWLPIAPLPAGKLAVLGLTYFLLDRFVAPPALMERWFGIDLVTIYRHTEADIVGVLMLMSLLLVEYAGIASANLDRIRDPQDGAAAT